MVAAAVIVVAIAAFGLGSAVATRVTPSPAPSGIAIATATPTPTAPPTARPTPTPTPDITRDAVSERLRDVYYNSIRGGWAICTVSADVACEPLANLVTDSGLDVSALRMTHAEWAKLSPSTVGTGEVVVMGFSNAEASNAFLVPIGAVDSPAARQVLPVNPQLVGLYYYGLGTLPPGEYGMSIGELVPVSNLAADPMYSWRARLVHFRVASPEGAANAPGVSAAPAPTVP